MKKVVIGIGLGTLAGLVDIVLMLVQNLPVNACLSAFSLWVITGLFVAIMPSKLHPSLKAIFIALLILLPSAFLIGWEKPATLIPIVIVTLILGTLLGLFYRRFTKEMQPAGEVKPEEQKKETTDQNNSSIN